MPSHLIILGDRDAVAWVVSGRRMAFTADRAPAASAAISVGDEIFLYVTRGAFHNPTRDRGRVFGRALATAVVEPLPAPVRLLGREFTHGFTFELGVLAPPRRGVDLAELVPHLSSFPNKTGWAISLRRPLFTLTPEDAGLIRRRLRTEGGDLTEATERYVAEARTPLPTA
jgi:hypothetical protein